MNVDMVPMAAELQPATNKIVIGKTPAVSAPESLIIWNRGEGPCPLHEPEKVQAKDANGKPVVVNGRPKTVATGKYIPSTKYVRVIIVPTIPVMYIGYEERTGGTVRADWGVAQYMSAKESAKSNAAGNGKLSDEAKKEFAGQFYVKDACVPIGSETMFKLVSGTLSLIPQYGEFAK